MNAVWNRALALSLLAAGAVGSMSGAAWATPSPPTPIAIVNPSFEADTNYTGIIGTEMYWYGGSFTGWNAQGGSGSGWFHPSTLSYPGGSGGSSDVAATGIPNGSQVAYVNGGSSLAQILSTTYQTNTEYQLSFYVGNRADASFGNYSVELLAGSNVVAAALTPVTPVAGAFSSYTLTFTSGFFDPRAGSALGIALLETGLSSTEVNFDALSLTQIANVNVFVPEPSTIALMSAGGLVLGFVSRRRQRTAV